MSDLYDSWEANRDVSSSAVVSKRADVGLFTQVHNGTIIEAGTRIGAHCSIGVPCGVNRALCIGTDCHVRDHSVLNEGSVIRRQARIGNHTLIRESNIVGEGFQLGGFSVVEPGCQIGDFVKTQAYCCLAPGTTVGDFSQLFLNVKMTDDPLPPSGKSYPVEIGKFVVVASNVLIMPGAKIGDLSFITAGSVVRGEVPPASVYDGDRIVMHIGRFFHPDIGRFVGWPLRGLERYYPEGVRNRVKTRYEELTKEYKIQ